MGNHSRFWNFYIRFCMDWSSVFIFLVPTGSFFAFIYAELRDWRRETRQEIARIEEEIKIQSSRSDKLYEVVIGLLEKGKL